VKRIVRTTGKHTPTDRETQLETKLECMRLRLEGVKAQLIDSEARVEKLIVEQYRDNAEAIRMRGQPIQLVIDRAEYADPAVGRGEYKLSVRDRHSGRLVENVKSAKIDKTYDREVGLFNRSTYNNVKVMSAEIETYFALYLTVKYVGTPPDPESMKGHNWGDAER
jgi:hypothetical protein